MSAPANPLRPKKTELVWVLSHSPEANTFAMEHLEAGVEEYPLPVLFKQTSLGRPLPGQTGLGPVLIGPQICAVVLVIEEAGLEDPEFRKWADWCLSRFERWEQLRLYPCLHGMDEWALKRRAEAGDKLVRRLYETVHFTYGALAKHIPSILREHLEQVWETRSFVEARARKRHVSSVVGWLAAGAQVASLVVCLVGALAHWTLGGEGAPSWLERCDQVLALALGVPLAPVLAVQVGVALGRRPYGFLRRFLQNSRSFGWSWAVLALLVLLHVRLPGTGDWVLLGAALGLLLDITRRHGLQQRWALAATAPMPRQEDAEKEPSEGGVEEPRDGVVEEPRDGGVAEPSVEEDTSNWREKVARATPSLLSCPYLPKTAPYVFISYSHGSLWSRRTADDLHAELRKRGGHAFLDREVIPEGSSWRQHLISGIGQASVVAAVVDAGTAAREWPEGEMEAALTQRRLSGSPDLVFLTHPGQLPEHFAAAQPAFRALLEPAHSDMSTWKPKIVPVREGTVPIVAAELSRLRYGSASILPCDLYFPARALLGPLLLPVFLFALIGVLAGWATLPVALLEVATDLEILEALAGTPYAAPVAVVAAYWLGFTLRLYMAAGGEIRHPGCALLPTLLVGMGGLGYLLVTVKQGLPAYTTVLLPVVAGVAWWFASAHNAALLARHPELAASDRRRSSDDAAAIVSRTSSD